MFRCTVLGIQLYPKGIRGELVVGAFITKIIKIAESLANKEEKVKLNHNNTY